MSGELYTQALQEHRTLEEKKKALNIINLMVNEITKKNINKNNG